MFTWIIVNGYVVCIYVYISTYIHIHQNSNFSFNIFYFESNNNKWTDGRSICYFWNFHKYFWGFFRLTITWIPPSFSRRVQLVIKDIFFYSCMINRSIIDLSLWIRTMLKKAKNELNYEVGLSVSCCRDLTALGYEKRKNKQILQSFTVTTAPDDSILFKAIIRL